MKKMMQWVMAATLICGATVFTACGNEDNPATSDQPVTDNVRMTQSNTEVSNSATGKIMAATIIDLEWENGLLKRQSTSVKMPSIDKFTTLGEQTYIYDDNNNCIEIHYTSATMRVGEYFTYVDGRMTTAVKMSQDDGVVTDKVTIHSYTDDGHVKTMTVEDFKYGYLDEYELTWINGDLISYTKHRLQPTVEDKTITASFDNYPNIHTGKPLADYIFAPDEMLVRGSKHNYVGSEFNYTYDNGRLVIEEKANQATYYTYSDGTTGRK